MTGLLLVIAIGAVGVPRFLRGPSPAPSPSVTGPTPTSSTTVAPPAPMAESDVFDGWGVNGSGSAAFSSDGQSHSGRASLLVSRTASAPEGESSIGQEFRVAQDSTAVVTFWATSTAADGIAAVRVRLGSAETVLPGGAYGWRRFTLAWQVPPKVTEALVSVVSTGPETGVRLDDFAVQGQGSRGVRVLNPGFETSSAAIAIREASLVLASGSDLHLASRLAPDADVDWTMQEYSGGRPRRGTVVLRAGAGELPLRHLPEGYYRLSLALRAEGVEVERSTDLVLTEAVPIAATTPLLGIGLHLGAESDAVLAQRVADVAALGFRAARLDADWGTIEVRPGQYEFAGLDRVVAAMERVGLRPLLVLDYRNQLYDGNRTPSTPAGIAAYARFAAAVAAHHPEADVEVYNEFDFRPNDGRCGTSAPCYLQLLRPTVGALRAAAPGTSIAGPGIAGIGVQEAWLQGFIAGGGLDQVDALSFHPYVQPDRPDSLLAPLAELRDAVRRAGRATPVWFTEFGDATVPGWLDERRQAEDVARVFGVGAASAVARVYWYDAVDDGTDRADNEDNFGLFRAPTSLAPAASVPKPAAGVVAALTRLTAGSGAGTLVPSASGGARTVVFGASGASVAWSVSGTASLRVGGDRRVYTMTGRALAPANRVTVGSSPLIATAGTSLTP